MSGAIGRVAVLIVNWNGGQHLVRCLAALTAQTYRDHEVVVVDNGSTDGSLDCVVGAWPETRVLALGENAGFARGNNCGLAATHSDWVALLNNDTVPDPGWLEALVGSAESGGDRLAAVASRMVFADQPQTINSAGIALDVAGIAWDRLGGAPREAGEQALEVFGASAGACLLRRAALEDVADPLGSGPSQVFDETFFMYLEDVDLAWRLRLRGWHAVYAPGALVAHVGSASAGEGSPFKNRLLARNKIWTLVKCYPTGPLALRWPVVLAYDLASAPYRFLVQGQTAAARGRLDALANLAEPLRRRRWIQARRTVSWSELRATLAPLDPPWAVLRRYRHLRPTA